MTDICINGGGFAGLSTALLLAGDGHRVTVVERDGPPPSRDPEQAWESWERRGVPHLRQTHAYLDRAVRVMREELPHVWTRMLEAEVREHDMSAHPPPTVPDPTAVDRVGVVVALGRRSTVEAVMRHAAEDDPRIDVRSGVAAKGLLTDGTELRVRGLATSAGPVEADLVVDCGGRRTAMPDWVEDAGGRPPLTEGTDFRITYWTQWFRLRADADMPVLAGRPPVEIGPIEVIRMPADNGWFSCTLVATSEDTRFRALSDGDRLVRVLRSLDLTADWTDPAVAEPVGAPLRMVSTVDRRRHYSVDGVPSLAGLVGVGDSIGASNPSLGRGTTFALMHASALRDLLRSDPVAETISERHEAALADEFWPWWDDTVRTDQAHLARMRSAAEGTEPVVDPGWMFLHAAHHDAELWQALSQVGGLRKLPDQLLGERPELFDRVGEVIARVGPPRLAELDVERLLAT